MEKRGTSVTKYFFLTGNIVDYTIMLRMLEAIQNYI